MNGVLHQQDGPARSVERSGIEDAEGRCVGWRLFTADGKPATSTVLEAATERLLCNPAVERAHFPSEE